jgi:hypothetical protein
MPVSRPSWSRWANQALACGPSFTCSRRIVAVTIKEGSRRTSLRSVQAGEPRHMARRLAQRSMIGMIGASRSRVPHGSGSAARCRRTRAATCRPARSSCRAADVAPGGTRRLEPQCCPGPTTPALVCDQNGLPFRRLLYSRGNLAKRRRGLFQTRRLLFGET